MLKTLAVGLVIVLCAFIMACDENGFPIDPIKNIGQIMVIHASPDAPTVNVYLENELFAKDFSYPTSSPYTARNEGKCAVALKDVKSDDVLLETKVDIQAGQYYSVFACDAASALSALVVNDIYAKPDSNESFIRIAHLSPDAPAVDISFNGTTKFKSAEFKDVSDFQAIEDGTYDIQVRLAGAKDVVFELKDQNLRSHVAYTIWVNGFVKGNPGQELGVQVIYNRVLL